MAVLGDTQGRQGAVFPTWQARTLVFPGVRYGADHWRPRLRRQSQILGNVSTM
jgi:hypothetical protein